MVPVGPLAGFQIGLPIWKGRENSSGKSLTSEWREPILGSDDSFLPPHGMPLNALQEEFSSSPHNPLSDHSESVALVDVPADYHLRILRCGPSLDCAPFEIIQEGEIRTQQSLP